MLNGSRKTFRAYFRILIYMHFQCLLYLLFSLGRSLMTVGDHSFYGNSRDAFKACREKTN